jgi:hypothetical protein
MPRLPTMSTQSETSSQGHSHFHAESHAASHARLKQEEFAAVDARFRNPAAATHFFGLSGLNPLFSHERNYGSTGNQTIPHPPASSLGFVPINRGREHDQLTTEDLDNEAPDCDRVKLENEIDGIDCIGADATSNEQGHSYIGKSLWNGRDLDDEIGPHPGIDDEPLGL